MVKMGTVWDRTVEFLADHLTALLPTAIFAIFVPISLSGSLEPVRESAAPAVQMGLAAATLVLVVVQVWGQLAITALALDPAIGGRSSAIATRRLLLVLVVSLLLLLMLMVLMAPIGVALVASGVDLAQLQLGNNPPNVPPGTALFIALYAVALLIVCLVAAARLAPLTPVLVAERRWLSGIGRAVRLTRGLTLRLIGVILLYLVVATVAGMAARTVFGSLLRLATDGDGPLTIAGVVTAVIVGAVQTGFAVLATVFVAKLYEATAREAAPAP